MDSLRDQIAALIEPFLAEDDWADGEADKVADAILQIPEIKEALELRAARMRLTDTHGWPPLTPNA